MKLLNIKYVPLMFLATISVFWSAFYHSSMWLNDYGQSRSEWMLFIDGFIVLPLICLLCIKDKKEAMLKALAYACLIVLLGSYIIPESSKFVWHYLESGRYLALAAFVTLEVVTIFTVILAIKASLQREQDPDLAISLPIQKVLAQSNIATLLTFEARVWTYFLFSRRVNQAQFEGNEHFYGHNKDGTQSNMLGFILLMAFELPIMHLLLHFVWSPFAANVVSGLTLVGLVFFIAEYKAIAIRPISICRDKVIIRYGVWNPNELAIDDILSVTLHNQRVRRAKHVKRYNVSGHPNVKVALRNGETVYLGLDTPQRFISQLQKLLPDN